jgi:glutathione S-transferase
VESTSNPVESAHETPQQAERSPRSRLRRRWAAALATGEAGMSTAEYAVGTVAACAFAAVLYRVVTGGSIVTGLTDLVESALATLS